MGDSHIKLKSDWVTRLLLAVCCTILWVPPGLRASSIGTQQEAGATAFPLSENMSGLLLGNYLFLYAETNQSPALTPAAAYDLYRAGKFTPSARAMPGFGIDDDTHWALLTIENSTTRPQTFIIEQRAPSFQFSLFRRLNDGSFLESRQGFQVDEPRGAVDYYLPAFEMEVPPGRHEILMRIKTLQPIWALLAWDPQSFSSYMKADFTVSGAIFGSMAVMVLYNLFVYIMARRKEHLFYVCYLSGFIMHQLFLSGFGNFVLGSGKVLLAEYWAVITAFGTLAVIEFSKSFLKLDGFKVTLRIMFGLQIYFIFVGFLSLYDMHWSNRLAVGPVIFCFGFITYAGFRRARQGFTPAYYFSIAWICQVLCIMTAIFSQTGVLPFTRWSVKVGPLGVLLEMVLISLAIGEKLKVEREEHYRERDTHIRNLSKQNEKIQHAFQQMKKVFFPHQVELIERGVSLEDTMPTGEREACVICFDIIGSSRIRHERTKEFFGDVFRRCHDLMMEGYDGAHLRSNAFRIKQMGDGFLCSVGFPFHSPNGRMVNDAVALAERFHAAFQSAVKDFGYQHPIHCCIGIAFESVSGFFPEAGTKEYDIFGRGIVLATRYESMRKHLFADSYPASLMILHGRVYNNLDTMQQKRFTTVELDGNRLRVRDDPDATHIHYRLMEAGEDLRQLPRSS